MSAPEPPSATGVAPATGSGEPGSGASTPLDFYTRPVLDVARDLLGATVQHGPVRVRITEVEAYGGRDDPASHAFRGPTPRAAVMFGPPGRVYVYFIYGMHWCFNIVCEPEGNGAAVLVRAGEVVAGLELARSRAPRLADRDLARGPGRLARSLALDGTATGTTLTGDGPVRVVPHPDRAGMTDAVATGPRIGIRAAQERPWRLWLAGDPTVSAGPTGVAAAGGRRGRQSQSAGQRPRGATSAPFGPG